MSTGIGAETKRQNRPYLPANVTTLNVTGDADIAGDLTGSATSSLIFAPTAQTVAEGDVISSVNACGKAKGITAASSVRTNTTNTFTNGTTTGCLLTVINIDAVDTITLDGNANFNGSVDVVLGPGQGTIVASDGSKWYLAGAGATPAGDVLSVADCPSGACLDGTSDGGSYIRIYDGDSHYGELQVPNIAGNAVYTLPAATSTLIPQTSPTLITPTLGVASATSLTVDPSSTPSVTFKDSDTTDEDNSSELITNCTATGTGAEECDLDIKVQLTGSGVAGVSTSVIRIDGSEGGVIGNSMHDGADVPATRETKTFKHTKSCAEGADACITFRIPTTHGKAECFVSADQPESAWCSVLIREDGSVILIEDGSLTDGAASQACSTTKDNDTTLNIYDGGTNTEVEWRGTGEEDVTCIGLYD